MSQARKIAAVMIAAGHVFALIGVWQMLSMPSALLGFKWFLAATAFYLVSGTTGITAGAHRLWSHRSYRAALPARVWIALCNTIANQSSILHWSKEHRVHHQYADTAADPYDITRGLFYAHMGWLYAPRTDAYALAVKRLDVSDMLSDPVVRLQDKYYVPLSLLCCFILPTLIGGYLSGGLYWQAFCILGCYRWIFTLHVTWTVNSFAHWIGDRPYDDASEARETRAVSIFSGGEGWHNFHHAYPWDYAASETAAVDVFWRFNLTKFWIDSLAALGLVYDRKVVRNPVRALERVRAAEAAAPPGDEHALYRGRF
jgi:stearoyl-CoA desaturase (delta-9 desaturase)